MNGVVNINGIEQKIYSVAAAAQFLHYAFMKGGCSLRTFQISRRIKQHAIIVPYPVIAMSVRAIGSRDRRARDQSVWLCEQCLLLALLLAEY